jgi:hypothetical protein
MIHLFTLLFCVSFAFSAEDAEDIKTTPSERNSRLFYVYTDKSTSTVLTTSLCYVTAGTAGTSCNGRRKRAVLMKQLGEYVEDVSSSSTEEDDNIDEDHGELIDSALEDAGDRNFREEKILLYWLTTTSISTKFSYTRTFTVASIYCVPSTWNNVNECGK